MPAATATRKSCIFISPHISENMKSASSYFIRKPRYSLFRRRLPVDIQISIITKRNHTAKSKYDGSDQLQLVQKTLR